MHFEKMNFIRKKNYNLDLSLRESNPDWEPD